MVHGRAQAGCGDAPKRETNSLSVKQFLRPALYAALLALAAVASAVQRFIEDIPNDTLQLTVYILCTMLALFASFVIGRYSGREAAQEILIPHSRNSFRRLTAVLRSLSKVAHLIDAAPLSQRRGALLAKIETHVWEQLNNADAALRGWEDIVPDQVQQLRRELREARPERDGAQ